MVRWVCAVAGLVVVMAGVSAGVAGAAGEEEQAVCARVLEGVVSGLVPTSAVCEVNVVGQGGR